MKNPVAIASIGTISTLGKTSEEIWKNYLSEDHFFQKKDIEGATSWMGKLPENIQKEVASLRSENSKYRHLDESVLFAILAGRAAFKNLNISDKDAGINIGSSRGATGLFEKYYSEYLKTGKSSIYSSPSTTLGNISSWVAQDLELEGPEFSHSVTCSTGMHSILNAIAWLKSGMAKSFLAGGSEAPLTGFTLAQMKAMKIYASENIDFPCRSLDMDKTRNSMILGEGAGVVALSLENEETPIAVIKGIGFANETLKHGASLSKDGKCLQKSMEMAMQGLDKQDIDAVVMHAPGTIGGDLSEVNAVKSVFQDKLPAITSNKWKTGHSFAASGILSLQMAILMLQHQQFLPVPFSEFKQEPDKLENILVNSVGFGGNAVSLLIGKK
ncbi:beta-ketoacyl synthase N-terminal-like domain-containing protein [Christiangramia forsetii]|uniref:3-oxoacyl-[acyl-carrier-protein] synthase n=2 Tax=Christiangramia forsetii TaxID=411153 RepID=A0M7A8_CHRFK|nr:beta-ketoacyl synthase N-terminal-like domain-containing protein [Christiangramia forsetii]GGG28312.1 beta-ketoacyl synthase [Christiangramia forsetii]CAL68503.1 3-oxoacyl-[acyl-carrier-protein] synthase [Christiangramia forsetii KT0803]